ncbi:VOC family protein [Terriglobus roseus]|uniref:Uncharacterized conserved protein PhnB, glyoxalase superfamily n=1 Tax=Terriglobus roseus TaxID=392734 RepID=A0A1H4P6V9_9BACT|nr:VOC family protein [Terriglobus roseus]SEC03187.1 Uncharacterized conserved protein PhnB, glyoxalase superfamily [Terriglobus roseus]
MSIPGQTVTIIPSVLCRDANAGIEWLKAALGFTEHAVYRTADGIVEHAELLLGNGMLMVGTAGHNRQLANVMALPSEVGGKNTSSVYLIVKDCTPVWQQALSAGAEVVLPLRTMDYGGQAFTVRDPDGHLWSVGEYDPWTVPA